MALILICRRVHAVPTNVSTGKSFANRFFTRVCGFFDRGDCYMDLVIDNDTHALRQAIESTQDALRAAVLDGNAEQLIELDARMRILSARAFGADVSDTKKTIDKAEREKISIAKEIELLREIKKQKNLAAGRAQELLRARMEKVNQAEFQIQLAENRLESARVTSRESKAKLQKLLDEKQREQASAYERYELSKY
jgi:hypothetical protein